MHALLECSHTPSLTFQNFPPNSAGIGYATEWAHFSYLRAAVYTDAVSALRKVMMMMMS